MRHTLRDHHAPPATVLIRVLVGAIFVAEGIQWFLHAETGAGRFARLGVPGPEIVAPLAGAVEALCGTLVLLGLFTRLAVVPLLAIAAAAFLVKLPMLASSGVWAFVHESRTDFAMIMGALFLWAVGAGPVSLDARRSRTPVSETWSE